ncbi:MAG: aminotransferase class V-fold PLP-dependent enzyme [Bacteroidales bacterium]
MASGELEKYFGRFREKIIGVNTRFASPFGEQGIIYGDWTASGRLYAPIEEKIAHEFGPFVANTHTETTETGSRMTYAYHHAQQLIKKHVNAGKEDVIITQGSGMTTVVNKFQRILGLKYNSSAPSHIADEHRPVVFITHMEHHSNHTSWYETLADVVILEPDENLLVNPAELRRQLELYSDRPFKIGAFTACSNVTGLQPPYYELARIMHEYGGIAFIDFAASAPYVDIDMHPADPMEKLDAIYFSPHKFLGGPGSSGVLVFDRSLYHCRVPDQPGGGTVDWTNPWGMYKYVDDIEIREDGGTPGFLQAIRAALAIRLKEKMGVDKMAAREEELVALTFRELENIPGIRILAGNDKNRLSIISFYHTDIHFNLLVRLLNDKFGIQVRGGCACAGTYGHYLLQVGFEKSHEITELINSGDLSKKPGWVRWSMHPTTTDAEVLAFTVALREIIENIAELRSHYIYNPRKNEFFHKEHNPCGNNFLDSWFGID